MSWVDVNGHHDVPVVAVCGSPRQMLLIALGISYLICAPYFSLEGFLLKVAWHLSFVNCLLSFPERQWSRIVQQLGV